MALTLPRFPVRVRVMIDWPRKYWTLAILAGGTILMLWLGSYFAERLAQRVQQRRHRYPPPREFGLPPGRYPSPIPTNSPHR